MGFLDVLDSIGAGHHAPTSQAQNSFPTFKSPPSSSISASASLKPMERIPRVGEQPTSIKGSKENTKEKYLASRDKPGQPTIKPASVAGLQSKLGGEKRKSQAGHKDNIVSVRSPAPTMTSANGPPKGSFAALMAQAKAAQEHKLKSEVGQIKHQATTRERMSKVGKRKREDEEKLAKEKLAKPPQHHSKVTKKGISSPKRPEESSYKGMAKPSQPVTSSYKGLAGLASKHRPSSRGPKHQARSGSGRYDEYLGTDEEEEDDDDDNESKAGDGKYASDVSSDMEADAFDVEEEESLALRQAKADDARELALESKIKRDKEDRKKKLQALAKRRR